MLRNFNVFLMIDSSNAVAQQQIAVIPTAIQSVLYNEILSPGIEVKQLGNIKTAKSVYRMTVQVKLPNSGDKFRERDFFLGCTIGKLLLTDFEARVIARMKQLSNTTQSSILDMSTPIVKALLQSPPGLIGCTVPQGMVQLDVVQSAVFENRIQYEVYNRGAIAVNQTAGVDFSITPLIAINGADTLKQFQMTITNPTYNTNELNQFGNLSAKTTWTSSGGADPNTVYVYNQQFSPLVESLTKSGVNIYIETAVVGDISHMSLFQVAGTLVLLGGTVGYEQHLMQAQNLLGGSQNGYRYAYIEVGPVTHDTMVVGEELRILNDTAAVIPDNTLVLKLDITTEVVVG